MGYWTTLRKRSQRKPTGLSRELDRNWHRSALRKASTHESVDGTNKLVLQTDEDYRIEAVAIPSEKRKTLCVSSQVGCSLDCTFCATGLLGLGRNLTADEIVDQVLYGSQFFAEQGEELSHIVFMGMGEPLLNLANVVEAIRILVEPTGIGFPQKNITVSTSGVVPKIAQLGSEVTVRLAVSLHATTDEVRNELVPLNKRFPLDQLLTACLDYPRARRKPMLIEYCLIRDVNDSHEDAVRLGEIVRQLSAKANVIPLNEHDGTHYRRPSHDRVEEFVSQLAATGAATSLRETRGDPVYAACGQLGATSEKGSAKHHRKNSALKVKAH